MRPEPDEHSQVPWSPQEVRRLWRRAGGGVADAFRTLGAGLVLNFRKTVWIRRGRESNAPCQSPSDSGFAGQTRCEASAYWRDRARFRRVCPHLQRQANGEWLCGADAVAVRTFWGRAAAWWAGCLLALWIGLSVPVWAFLWKSGVRVPYRDVAWPGGWAEISRARARFYVYRAEQALGNRKYDEMLLSLQAALRSDPMNLQARVYLANVAWVQGNFALANERFAGLLADFPAERPQLARVWLPKLLVVGDFAGIKPLAAGMVKDDPAAVGPWAHALIFAARQTGDPVALVEAMRETAIPPALRPVIAAQAAGVAGQRDTAVRLLNELAAKGPHAQFIAYQRVEGLLEYGAPDKALALLNSDPGNLSASDLLYFRLRAYHQMGWDETVQVAIRDSFRAIDLPRLDALALYLVRCHDRAGLIRVLAALQQAPRADKLDATFSMLYLAAGLWGDRDQMPTIAKLASEKSPLPVSLLGRFDALALRPGQLGQAMGALPLPMESVYAAYAALHEVSAAPAPKAK